MYTIKKSSLVATLIVVIIFASSLLTYLRMQGLGISMYVDAQFVKEFVFEFITFSCILTFMSCCILGLHIFIYGRDEDIESEKRKNDESQGG